MDFRFPDKSCWLLLSLFLFLIPSCKKQTSSLNDQRRVKVARLLSDAQRHQDTLMNPKAADSLSDEIIKISMFSDDPELIAVANTAALKYRLPANMNSAQAKECFVQAVINAEKLKSSEAVDEAYFAYCEYLIRENQPQDALNYLNMISENSPDQSKQEAGEIRKLIIHSKINQIQNRPADQLENLIDADYLAADLENDSIKYETLSYLSDFYLLNKKHEKALEYLAELKKSVESAVPVDSVRWYYTESARLVILNRYMDHKVIPEMLKKIDDFGRRNNIPRLRFQAQSALRTYFIDHNQFQMMDDWYKKNPQELKYLKKQNLSYYHRVRAYIAENRKQVDSARHYFELSAAANDDGNPYFYYIYYLRKGEFEKRQGQDDAALTNFEEAFQYSLQSNNYYDQIKVGEKIAALYRERGDAGKELEYANLTNTAKNSLIKFLSDENVQSAELNNILAQKELERQKIQEKKDRQHNLQYLIITCFIILIIMSLVVISFYRVPVWWIKSMGYVSFIMFFEFIVLLIDGWLHHLTHGSPVLILLGKVVIISGLFPLHHWIEKTVVNILLKKNDLTWFWHQFLRIIHIKKGTTGTAVPLDK